MHVRLYIRTHVSVPVYTYVSQRMYVLCVRSHTHPLPPSAARRSCSALLCCRFRSTWAGHKSLRLVCRLMHERWPPAPLSACPTMPRAPVNTGETIIEGLIWASVAIFRLAGTPSIRGFVYILMENSASGWFFFEYEYVDLLVLQNSLTLNYRWYRYHYNFEKNKNNKTKEHSI